MSTRNYGHENLLLENYCILQRNGNPLFSSTLDFSNLVIILKSWYFDSDTMRYCTLSTENNHISPFNIEIVIFSTKNCGDIVRYQTSCMKNQQNLNVWNFFIPLP